VGTRREGLGGNVSRLPYANKISVLGLRGMILQRGVTPWASSKGKVATGGRTRGRTGFLPGELIRKKLEEGRLEKKTGNRYS